MKELANKLLIGLAMFATLVSQLSLTAQNKGIPITVEQSYGKDAVGRAFTYDVKNEIGRSSLFQNVNEKLGFHLDIRSVSEQESGQPNNSSALSIALTLNTSEGIYLVQHWVSIVGVNRTADQAKNLMVNVNEDMETIMKAAAKASSKTGSY